MKTKLIFRVLTIAGELLGWTEHMALAKGDGKLWTTSRVVVPIEAPGVAHELSMHWVDINIDSRIPLPPHTMLTVKVGDTLLPFEADVPAIVVGPMPAALPPVTVRTAVLVTVPVGDLVGRT